jgi:enoyl-[acyl-carrier protein] reductase/trans-2-enoyl-CoA reductase (NAD+)
MDRLFREHLATGHPATDEAGRIRLDDREMDPAVQAEVRQRWQQVNTANLTSLADFEGYQAGFLRLFGFGLAGVDYAAETDPAMAVPSLAGGRLPGALGGFAWRAGGQPRQYGAERARA